MHCNHACDDLWFAHADGSVKTVYIQFITLHFKICAKIEQQKSNYNAYKYKEFRNVYLDFYNCFFSLPSFFSSENYIWHGNQTDSIGQ